MLQCRCCTFHHQNYWYRLGSINPFTLALTTEQTPRSVASSALGYMKLSGNRGTYGILASVGVKQGFPKFSGYEEESYDPD